MTEYYNKIKTIAKKFTNGDPISKEVYIDDEEIIFHFDNPFEDDVHENYVVASLLVSKNEYNLDECVDSLYEYDNLENIENNINNALLNGGFKSVSIEFDKTNTTDSYWCYAYTLVL